MYCPFKEIMHFLLLFSQTEALFFPFSEAAFPGLRDLTCSRG